MNTATWDRIHADWWQDEHGEAIHRVEVLDDNDDLVVRFYGYPAANCPHHCSEAASLAEAQRQLEDMRAEA